jgi:hypothetical protein
VILEAHGVRLELPPGWSGRLFKRQGGIVALHAGDYALDLNDTSTFGDASTTRMPAAGTFLVLAEYAPGQGLIPGRGLFAPRRIPRRLDPSRFSHRGLAHPRPGQVGTQHFFTLGARPFCLYVVIAGDRLARRRRLAELDHLLNSLEIEPRRVEHSTV